MGDNLGPNGVVQGVLLQSRFTRQSRSCCVPRGAVHGVHHYGSERAFAVKPARQRRCPCGLRGLTAQRAQASGYHAKNTEKRSLGPGIGLMEPRGELGFIQPRSSFSYQLTTTPTRCQESICLVYIKQTVDLSDVQIRAAHSFASWV